VLERRVLLLVLLHVLLLLLLLLLLELLLLLKGGLVLVQARPHHHGRQAVGVVGVGEPAGLQVAPVAPHQAPGHQQAPHGGGGLGGSVAAVGAVVVPVAAGRRRAPLLGRAANRVEGVFAALVKERVLVGPGESAPGREGEAVQVELPLKARDFGMAEVPDCGTEEELKIK